MLETRSSWSEGLDGWRDQLALKAYQVDVQSAETRCSTRHVSITIIQDLEMI